MWDRGRRKVRLSDWPLVMTKLSRETIQIHGVQRECSHWTAKWQPLMGQSSLENPEVDASTIKLAVIPAKSKVW